MPFFPTTPESLISRTDSKDPRTTCNGITQKGQPCGRSTSRRNSPSPSPRSRERGPRSDIEDRDNTDEAFFCHDHKNQAKKLTDRSSPNLDSPDAPGLKQEPDIDTITNWLSNQDLQDSSPLPESQNGRRSTSETRMISLSVSFDISAGLGYVKTPQVRCNYDSYLLPAIVEGDNPPVAQISATVSTSPLNIPTLPTSQHQQSNANDFEEQDLSLRNHTSPIVNARPSLPRDPSSRTQILLSLIPKTISPQITSDLLKELSLPIPPSDNEDGWIYIYWLTPSASPVPDSSFSSSLLGPPPTNSNAHARRTSDVIQEFSIPADSSHDAGGKKPTMLLKIGRASNVQRRMNEWMTLCKFNITVIKYYPCGSSARSPSPSPSRSPVSSPPSTFASIPCKVRHVKRVERLIHLELKDQQVKRQCEGCGKEHREWFEVKGTRDGLRRVDEVINRWVRWAQDLRP